MTTAINTAMGSAKEAIGSAKHAAKDAAEDAAVAVKDTADEAAKTAKKIVSFLRHVDMDDVLGLIGLRRRSSPFAAIALVGGGILVGAGITLLFAPLSGRDTREQIRRFFETLGTKAKEEAEEVKGKAQDVKEDVKARAGRIAEDVKGKASEVASDVKEKVSEMAGQATEGEEAQTDDTGEERKGRRRTNQNAQVS